MPSTEPRVDPPAGENATPVAAPTGATANGAKGTNGNGSNGANGAGVATVTVAASVESALFAVQRQLEREADRVRVATVVAPAPAPAPVVLPEPVVVPAPAPVPVPVAPAPPARVREVMPVVVEPEDDDLESEFWGEPRRRAAQRKIDPKLLTREERKALGKLRARKVRRIVRHVSPWSVFKFSIFFYLCVWLILMVAGVILWKLSQTAGVVTNFEKFYAKAAGEKSFEIDGRALFRAGSTAGAILVFAATGFTVLLSVLFNLITDLTGGIRMTVIELESTRRTVRRRAGSERLRSRARVTDEELERAGASGRRAQALSAVTATAADPSARDSMASDAKPAAAPKTSATSSGAASSAANRATNAGATAKRPEVVPEPRRREPKPPTEPGSTPSKTSSN